MKGGTDFSLFWQGNLTHLLMLQRGLPLPEKPLIYANLQLVLYVFPKYPVNRVKSKFSVILST